MPSRTKRKSTSPVDSKHDNKKTKNSSSSRQHHPLSQEAEKHGIVLRKYYPPEMSNARAQAYADEEIQRPIEELQAALEETAKERESVKPSKSVIHWFKMDMRHTDNTALALASQKAQDAGVPLICVYLLSPQDFEAHLLSPARVDFMLRSLAVLQKDLDKLDIPLHIETVEQRSKIPDRMLELMDQWGASHVFANMEYEVDELRREAYMVRDLSENGKSFDVVHDTCVVPPGSLQTGTGKQYAVYSPWYRAWVAHIHGNLDLLELHEPPAANPKSARKDFSKLFGCAIPAAPKSKALGAEDKKRLEALWPAGEHEALARLDTFCKKKIGGYADTRSTPSADGTSCISVHLASGTISSRTCVRTARDRNTTKKLNGGKDGVASWISEVAWRDFYRHVLASWPYVW